MLTNIWRRKSQLINLIIEKKRLLVNATQIETRPDPTLHETTTNDSAQEVSSPTPQEATNDSAQEVSSLSARPPETTHYTPLEAATRRSTTHEAAPTLNEVIDDNSPHAVNVRELATMINSIKTKLEIKDLEIELLNSEMKAAYNTIDNLQQRVVELEGQRKESSNNQPEEQCSTPPITCLLLGDSSLQPILRSDLHAHTRVRTIAEANMDLLRSWVIEKLNQIPSECVIYSGIYDILDEKSPAAILDNLGSLISDLKERNNDMNIYVCQIVPSPTCPIIQVKIEDYNTQLFKWGEANGIDIVQTVPPFLLGTGELDEFCYDMRDNSHSLLNRQGIIKLLTAIERQCPGFHLRTDWQKAKRNSDKSQAKEEQFVHMNNKMKARRTPDYSAPAHVSTPTQQAALPTHNQTKGQPSYRRMHHTHRPWQRSFSNSRGVSLTSNSYSGYTPGVYAPTPGVYHNPDLVRTRGTQEQRTVRNTEREADVHNTYAAALKRVPGTHHTQQTNYRPQRSWNGDHAGSETHGACYETSPRHSTSRAQLENINFEGKKAGCFNCGEFNHVRAYCRYDHKILCSNCRHLGHKSRLCHHYNTQ